MKTSFQFGKQVVKRVCQLRSIIPRNFKSTTPLDGIFTYKAFLN